MAQKNNKKKTNTNNKKNNTKKVETKKVEKEIKEKVIVKNEEVVETEKKVVSKKVREKMKFELTPKQKDIILVLLVAVVLIIALVLTGNKNKLDIELPIALEGTAGFNEITYTEYEEKLNTEAPFLVVIVNDGCGYCDMYKPVVEEVANEYNLPISYINLANLTSEEKTLLSSSNSYLKKQQWGTPTTLFMYGDSVVETIGGYIDKDEFVEFVKENFVVAENE